MEYKPVINKSAFVKKLPKKILNRVNSQSTDEFNLEIIVIDDCSTDGSQKIMESNLDLVSNYIKLEKNGGKGKAVREGLKKATGDYILFQDGDLEYNPEDYNKIFKVIENFDALEVNDNDVNYLRTSWVVDTFDEFTIRTRLIARVSDEDPIEVRFKIVSERARGQASPRDDELFRSWQRIMRKYEGLIEEIQSTGKLDEDKEKLLVDVITQLKGTFKS